MIYIFALLGGLLMNATPCLLPVLGFKLKSITTPKTKLPYLLGVFCSFMIIATMSVVLGTGLSHMSSFYFRATMATVCFLMALHMLGAWEMKAISLGRLGTWGGQFGTGLITVALGTSCTIPFLSPVIVYCATSQWWETYLLFANICVGFCSPFLLPLPVPRPGKWMHRFEVGCGLGVLLTAIWLLSTLFAAKVTDQYPEEGPRVLHVSAAWCAVCKIQVDPLWHDQEVLDALGSIEVTHLDWTNRNEAVTGLLQEHDHEAVPFALVENYDGKVTILSGVYTKEEILEALE